MTDLNISKKSISELFREVRGGKFIVPDFQRPYKWDVEKCETLWIDIQNFIEESEDDDDYYFLGTIVCYQENKDIILIDGQQRVTSLFLMLRAFYKKLEAMQPNSKNKHNIEGLKSQIEPCIWEVEKISRQVKDRKSFHISSHILSDTTSEAFHLIMETGEANPALLDNYSVNYRIFTEKCDQFASDQPLAWFDFCVTVLNHCVILPIECSDSNTALTIFSTLNDRGMPLSDSDIFKAQIYKSL